MAGEQGDYSYADDQELVDQFLTWTSDAVKELREIVTEMEETGADQSKADRVYDISHNIKGMGASFNFGLMTTVGTSLCRYIKTAGDGASARGVGAHVRIFEVVLENKITGEGGEKGEALVKRLAEIVSEES
ncbi:hypothetical protein [Kordiimonas sp.]|uniref:hypothetical protein n=1 Tax=Kordiimonas sp. TaxID=1970157 RepID=UPI003A90D971